jgi:hypothetical protein
VELVLLNLVVAVVTLVVAVVVTVVLVKMHNPDQVAVVVMVVLEKKFQQHTYQIHSHKMIQDHHLVNS